MGTDAFNELSLYDISIKTLHRRGFEISEDVLNRDVTKPYQHDKSVQKA